MKRTQGILLHYKNMKEIAEFACEIAQSCNIPVDVIGASEKLIDFPIEYIKSGFKINFIDIRRTKLNGISLKLDETFGNWRSNGDVQFLNRDVTGFFDFLKKKIMQIYSEEDSVINCVERVIELFDQVSGRPEDIYQKEEKVLLSLNVVSELQPPVRMFLEKIHKLKFNVSLKDSLKSEKEILERFSAANKNMYTRIVADHFRLAAHKYSSAAIIVSGYEKGNIQMSYIKDGAPLTDEETLQSYIIATRETRSVLQKSWDWPIAEDRTIRINALFYDHISWKGQLFQVFDT